MEPRKREIEMRPCRTIQAVPFILLGAIFLGCTDSAGEASRAGDSSASLDAQPAMSATAEILDGSEKSIVVVGYSTSYAWPEILQEMLDVHAGGERVYHIVNAVIGGSPVGRWIAEPGSEDYEATYGAMERDFLGPEPRLLGSAPRPTVAILQQSLQRTPTPETPLGPVTSVSDTEGIEVGADALERLVSQLRSDGVTTTVIAMHIYKEGYEPEVGNERFALEALLDRGHPDILRGPDVWSLTIGEHPQAFTEDRLHPNELGAKIMAEAWYRTLAGDAAREDLIEEMRARSYDEDAMMAEYLEWRRGG